VGNLERIWNTLSEPIVGHPKRLSELSGLYLEHFLEQITNILNCVLEQIVAIVT
jgi:hypothetical protein